MRLDSVDRHSFPKFAKYISEDFPKLRDHRLIRHALAKYGRMTDVEVFTTLGPDTGPRIFMTALNDEYTITYLPNLLGVNYEAVKTFEADDKGKSDSNRPALVFNRSGRRLYALGFYILTTLVYCNVNQVLWKSSDPKARSLHNISAATSAATAGFEREVYGRIQF
jgi:hypothetical protein